MISDGPGKPVLPPAAYVILDQALRPIVADTIDTLQDGTLDSTSPLLSTVVATEGWLRRFHLPDDQINTWWVELHKTPKVTDERAAIEALTQKLRERMGLPGRSA